MLGFLNTGVRFLIATFPSASPLDFTMFLKAEKEGNIFGLPPVGDLGVYSKKKHTEKRNEICD